MDLCKIARLSATRPASLIASEIVGCGAMPFATVSMHRLRVENVGASLNHVGHVRPNHHQAEELALRVSWIDFTQPAVSFCITARVFATHGKIPTAMLSPYCSCACASVRPTWISHSANKVGPRRVTGTPHQSKTRSPIQ